MRSACWKVERSDGDRELEIGQPVGMVPWSGFRDRLAGQASSAIADSKVDPCRNAPWSAPSVSALPMRNEQA